MIAWSITATAAIAIPLACGTGWLLVQQIRSWKRRPRRWSVAAIAHRISLETTERPVRWPRADPDHGRLGDNRPSPRTQAPRTRPYVSRRSMSRPRTTPPR